MRGGSLIFVVKSCTAGQSSWGHYTIVGPGVAVALVTHGSLYVLPDCPCESKCSSSLPAACSLLYTKDSGPCLPRGVSWPSMALSPSSSTLIAISRAALLPLLYLAVFWTGCALPQWHWDTLWLQLMYLCQPPLFAIIFLCSRTVIRPYTSTQSVSLVQGLTFLLLPVISCLFFHAGH